MRLQKLTENDDIWGTGASAASGLLGISLRLFQDQKVVAFWTALCVKKGVLTDSDHVSGLFANEAVQIHGFPSLSFY